MKAWVTGGLGFIGSRVIERLVANGIQTVCVDRRAKLESYQKTGLPIFKRIMRAASGCVDVCEPEHVLGRSHEYDTLIHLGAVVDTGKAGADILRENIDYSRSLFPLFSRGIVFASSGAVYGNKGHPDTVYGMTKAVGERMLSNRNPSKSISLRFMNVYGEDEHHKGAMASMPFKMTRAYATNDRIALFNVTDRRDFVHVDDVASAIVAAAARVVEHISSDSLAFDVGSGTAVSFSELDDLIRGDRPSLVEEVAMPPHLIGKYQSFTMAGSNSVDVKNIFQMPWYRGLKPRNIKDEIGGLGASLEGK